MAGRAGIEPATIRLKVECSTPELPARGAGQIPRKTSAANSAKVRRNIAGKPPESIEIACNPAASGAVYEASGACQPDAAEKGNSAIFPVLALGNETPHESLTRPRRSF